ncbi:MAG: LysR family transcriptional regulator [Bdellovibrionaceae bacterium]|nr:LysR family transcriptional regulator [Pseudobdellovibrionaceae bacterium]
MSLSSHHLDAFLAVAKTNGFSSAANQLHITQSALSQRVKNLEDELGLTLFIRTTTGVTLTEAGERLLRYCQTRDSLEQELVHDLNISNTYELTGSIRIAAYSSVLRSVIIPALKPLLEKHPNILCEFICAKMPKLPLLLQSAEVDFIVMDYALERANLQRENLGQEKYVIIESKKSQKRHDIYLDNDSADRATEMFFKSQNIKLPKYRRSYFDDCYGIIDGVTLGLGKAIMPKHLVAHNPKLKITESSKAYNLDVVLHYYQQPIYSKLHLAVLETIKKNAPPLLS